VNGYIAAVKAPAEIDPLADLRRKAEGGDPAAMARFGDLYRRGQGVPQDLAMAFGWFKKAAEAGEASAQAQLSLMYSRGRGVQKSDEEAARLYEQAANQGDGHAQARLGELYLVGKGVQRDPRKAYNWLLLAGARLEGPEQLRAQMGTLKVKVLLTPEQQQAAERWAKEWRPKPEGKQKAITSAIHVDPEPDE
jgi:hypothetical protein